MGECPNVGEFKVSLGMLTNSFLILHRTATTHPVHRWSGHITPWKVQIWWKYFGNGIVYISRCDASLELAEPPFQTLNLFLSVRWFGWSWKVSIDRQFWSEGGFKDTALPKHRKLNKWLVTEGEAGREVSTQLRIPSFHIQVPLFDVERSHIWVIETMWIWTNILQVENPILRCIAYLLLPKSISKYSKYSKYIANI